jgi:hypothetical protein
MNLPPVLPLQSQVNEVVVPVAPVVPHDAKEQFILCITKDLSIEDKALFGKINLVEYEDRIHKNLHIETLDFDVLVMDMRETGDRYAFVKEIQPKKDKYNIVCYCHAFERDEIVPEADNTISKLPEKQATAQQFLDMLLIKRISKPRWYVSLFRCVLSSYHQLKN